MSSSQPSPLPVAWREYEFSSLRPLQQHQLRAVAEPGRLGQKPIGAGLGRGWWDEGTVDLAGAAEDARMRARATVGPYAKDGWMLLVVVQLVLTLCVWAVGVILLAYHHYNMTMYTYWSFTIVAFTYLLLSAALFVEGRLLAATLLFVLPVALGTTFGVCLLIVVAVQLNGNIFMSAITGDTGSGDVHSGDFILHTLPFLGTLILLVAGLQRYVSAVLTACAATWSPRSPARWLYVAYFLLAPLVPMFVYTFVFDPAVQYPTGIPTWVLWLVVLLFDFAWMLLLYKAFTANYHVAVRICVPVLPGDGRPSHHHNHLHSSPPASIPSVETRDGSAAPSSSDSVPLLPVLHSFNTPSSPVSSLPDASFAGPRSILSRVGAAGAHHQGHSSLHGAARPQLVAATAAAAPIRSPSDKTVRFNFD